ncbi:TPA: hypothetical protein SLN25_002721 [Serratia marcescens]|uniref:hypothetical protein n=1 Tax=Serratia marcescens TaxID=615 RepID=UPI0029D2C5E7|nr:hypothetical protein [Serratia marcescens]
MRYLRRLSTFVKHLLLLVLLSIDVADAAWITRFDLDNYNKSYTSLIYERKEQSALISFDCKDGLRVTFKISTRKKYSFKGNEYVDLVFIIDKNDPLILNAEVELINSKHVNIFNASNEVIKELITQLQMARKKIYVEAREIGGQKLFSTEVHAAGSTLAANEFIMYCKIELPIDVPHNR